MATNPRWHNGNYRRKVRARFKAMGATCGICQGRLGPIRYDQKSCADNPLSFCVDEIRPCSRWREFGYDSIEAACMDYSNLQATHWCCNAMKSNKLSNEKRVRLARVQNIPDGEW